MSHPIDTVVQTNDEFKEIKILMYEAVLATNAKLILETGTYLGNSTRIWSCALEQTGGEIWTMDLNPPLCDFQHPNIHCLKGNSLILPWDRIVDILFLDSDHSYDHVVQELARFTPFIRPGGKLMLHDYLHEGQQKGSGRDIRRATEEWVTPRNLPITTWPVGAKIGYQWGMGVVDIPF